MNFAKKKAALCLLRLYRKHPEMFPVSDWCSQIIEQLDDYDLVRIFMLVLGGNCD